MSPQTFRSSQLVRVFLISILILLLQIPTVMLQNLVRDRQDIRQEAVSSITANWGGEQSIIGPRLAVPYTRRITADNGKTTFKSGYGIFLPDDLEITGKLDSEIRYRGIFEVPLYQTQLQLKGRFSKPDLSAWSVRPEEIEWDRAELSLQISDARAIQNQAILQWNQTKIPFTAGLGKFGGGVEQIPGMPSQGINANLKGQMQGDSFSFSLPMTLKGSEKIRFAPYGKVSKVTLNSDWKNPSFQGAWLPSQRNVTEQGFTSTWEIPSLGRNYPQQWNKDSPVNASTILNSMFGVDLISPIDNYRMADRSIKYNFLFLVLTFVVFWLFETATRLRVHPLQYLLVGVAMTMFYLLQLAISEHLGFAPAYLIASIAVVTMLTAYSVAVLKAKKRGAIIGVLQVVLYVYLFVVLANQDYSLLMGSLGLFGFLGIVMYFTRNMERLEPGADRPAVVSTLAPIPPETPPQS
jgi:inner membrane protein